MTDKPDPTQDLAGGETLSGAEARTVGEVLREAKSRREHRLAAAALIYIVVCMLILSVWKVVDGLAADLTHLNPAAVGLVASMVVGISVLTIALAKFAYGMSNSQDSKQSPGGDAISPPSVEVFKAAGDVLGKLGEAFKAMKP